MTAAPGTPIICLVTDRHRALRGGTPAAIDCLVAVVAAAAEGGVDLVQVRERDLDGGALVDLTARAVEAVRGSRTRVVVNDRVDVAIAAAAHGVHLRADSFPVAAARQLAPGLLVGRSVHSAAEALSAAAAGADYFIAGTVFATTSKPAEQVRLGVSGLAAIARATPVPVLAIGGITPAVVDAVAAAGAAGIAGIGCFLDETAGGCRASTVTARAIELRRSFDRVKGRS